MAAALVVVDAANVIGSVPDGWWRDRAGAARRLRDALVPVATSGLPGGPEPPVEVVLVVEGAARRVESVPGVRVVAAPGSGDDTLVDVAAEAARRATTVVVTADRGLRARLDEVGARAVGPSWLVRLVDGR